jgi:hypothetical protein
MVDRPVETYEYGKFGWIKDPEGKPHQALGTGGEAEVISEW